jgi:hypothetical protein
MLYGVPATVSPPVRVNAVVLLVNALSSIATEPFHVVTVRFTNPPSVTPTPASDGSSAPYTFVWFATVAVRFAGVTVNVGVPVNDGAL